jgi:hypothetical protein
MHLGLAHNAHVHRKLPSKLRDGEFRGSDNRLHVVPITRRVRNGEEHLRVGAVGGGGPPGLRGESELRRLQDRGRRGADDVVPSDAGLGVTPGKNRRQPLPAVSTKTNLEHVS